MNQELQFMTNRGWVLKSELTKDDKLWTDGGFPIVKTGQRNCDLFKIKYDKSYLSVPVV